MILYYAQTVIFDAVTGNGYLFNPSLLINFVFNF